MKANMRSFKHSGKNRFLTPVVVLAVGLASSVGVYAATQIQSIDFSNATDASVIEIKADGPIQFNKQENAGDKQLVLELSGVTLGPQASRALDTSSFQSPVKLISPFQVEGQPENARLVVQLNEMAASDVSQDGNTLRIRVAKPQSADQASATPPPDVPPPPADAALPQPPADTAALPPPPTDAALPPPPAEAAAGAVNPASNPNDKLGNFLSAQASQRFMGKPITLQLRDADLVDVFRLIGEASGFNIVVGDDVKGKVTLSLAGVPWDQALDMVLRTNKLGAERNNNVLRIATLQNLVQEKNQQIQAKLASEASAPRVTRIFPISYANLNDLQRILNNFVSGASSSVPGAGSGAVGGAMVQADPRTNSIVVRDTVENIDKMKRLIELLDTQTPQVLIEAKVVEVSKTFGRDLTGQLGLGYGSTTNPTWFGSFNAANSLAALTGTTSSARQGLLGTSIDLSIIPGISRLNAALAIGENESQVKVVSTPRTVVLNKQTANILQSIPTVLLVQTITNAGAQATYTVNQANISLNVTPTVTNDGSVLMSLNVSRDVPTTASGQSVIANRNLSTQVLVESGSTLSIGGVYTQQRTESEDGFPFLRKIPVLGWFFGNTSLSDNQSELMIFVTPKILNSREAGLTPAI